MTGWLGVSLVAVAVGGRFFGHYFHQVTGPLAVLAAPTVALLWRRRPGLIVAWVGIPVVAFFLVAVFHGEVMAAAGAPDPDYDTIARFIDEHSTADEELVVWGNSPVLYFMANRPLGSRFVFSNYLTGLSPATRTQTDPSADASANVVPAAWDMLESDLASRKPAMLVDLSAGDVAGYGKFPPTHFPRLNDILERDYVFVGRAAGGRGVSTTSSHQMNAMAGPDSSGDPDGAPAAACQHRDGCVFIVASVANIVPVWAFRYCAGQDMPNHLFGADVLSEP